MRVTSFGTLFDWRTVLLSLDEAALKGQWLVFDNCHLLDDWDQSVVRRICQLISQLRGGWPSRIPGLQQNSWSSAD